MPTCSFQLHKLECVFGRPSELYGDSLCMFSPDAKVTSVPLMWLYGRMADGSSVCAKIRNVYPYFFVELPPSPFQANEEFICKVGAGIDFALTGKNEPTRSLVHRIDLVQARILYHYHRHPKAFLRISLYSPYIIKKAVEAFQTGRIAEQPFRCYEAHLSYALQFMMDHNLFGMHSVVLEDANVIDDEDGGRASSCDIELECSASQIRNIDGLTRFGALRENSEGRFPSYHVMPSVVSMLESLGLNTASQSQAREVGNRVSMDCASKYGELLARHFASSSERTDAFVESLPKAYSFKSEPCSVLSSGAFDRFSFGFSSQQILRISMGFKAVQVPPKITPLADGSDDFEELEGILGDMLHGEMLQQDNLLASDLGEIPQYDGPDGDFLHNWSDASHESQSLIGNFAFSDDDDASPIDVYHASIPPKTKHLLETLRMHKIPRHLNPRPITEQPEPSVIKGSKSVRISPAVDPPINYTEALEWLRSNVHHDSVNPRPAREMVLSQIAGPTQKGTPPPSQDSLYDLFPSLSSSENLSFLFVEFFGDSRGALMSDPENDPVLMICWYFVSSIAGQGISLDGVIALGASILESPKDWELVSDEHELLESFIERVKNLDPDILAGWEIDSTSWGHLQARAARLGVDLKKAISRNLRDWAKIEDISVNTSDPNVNNTSAIQVHGRICVNAWRVLKAEFPLKSSAFEHAAQMLLHRHYPSYRQVNLRKLFFGDRETKLLPRPDSVASYFLARAKGTAALLNRTEILGRICEFSRVYGVDFFSIISRGSQFKVESLLLRLARLENLLAYSPSKADVVRMAAPEALPLVLEPKSAWYSEPVVVLDFQALYPSIAIAYNLCYSTCLGKVTSETLPRVFGANFVQDGFPTTRHKENIAVMPNGVGFVSKNVREGILPKMLTELLEARISVKTALASETDSKRKKGLDARQLGLKLISNVTYGYTAAAFSGRMPCVELADAIVQTGRATLEFAIRTVSNHPDWDAEVVYGDTDSMFICLPGRNIEEAHVLGREIAAHISAQCPPPVKLKFEKVYMPCALMSKKRYIGFASEKAEQGKEPFFDAKGIETVRRDTCPLVAKLLERSLKILARSNDLEQVRHYVQRQFSKILAGARWNLADFVFCKEVRLGSYAADRHTRDDEDEMDVEAGQRPHSAIIALQRIQQDPRDKPQYGERVPYVIVYGQGNDKLRELVASPEELLINPYNRMLSSFANMFRGLKINGVYYLIKCIIPALNRVFGLLSADVNDWYASLPRPTSRPIAAAPFIRMGKTRSGTHGIESFFKSSQCVICADKDGFELTKNGATTRICKRCINAPNRFESISIVMYRLHHVDRELNNFFQLNYHQHRVFITDLTEKDLNETCLCTSLDCPLFWKAIALRQNDIPLRELLLAALKVLS